MGNDLIAEPLLSKLENFLEMASESELGFTIGSLSDYTHEEDYYITPVRSTKRLKYMGAIVKNVETAVEIARIVDGKVDYLFVDSEKKIHPRNYGQNDVGNIEKAISNVLHHTKLLPYKGNDLTVLAADSLIRVLTPNLTGAKIAIVGVSNIGMKLALSLLERGNNVCLFSRDLLHAKSTADLLNKMKMRNVLVECGYAENLEKAIRNSDLVISCSNGKSTIGIKEINQMQRGPIENKPILVDVGKGAFNEEIIEYGHLIHRVDVGDQLSREIDNLLELESRCARKTSRKVTEEITLVRIGIVGKKGDYVVDDPDFPQNILGQCDGKGNLITVDANNSKDIINLCLTKE